MLKTFNTPGNSLFAQNKDNQFKAQIKRTRTGQKKLTAICPAKGYTLVYSTNMGGQKP